MATKALQSNYFPPNLVSASEHHARVTTRLLNVGGVLVTITVLSSNLIQILLGLK